MHFTIKTHENNFLCFVNYYLRYLEQNGLGQWRYVDEELRENTLIELKDKCLEIFTDDEIDEARKFLFELYPWDWLQCEIHNTNCVRTNHVYDILALVNRILLVEMPVFVGNTEIGKIGEICWKRQEKNGNLSTTVSKANMNASFSPNSTGNLMDKLNGNIEPLNGTARKHVPSSPPGFPSKPPKDLNSQQPSKPDFDLDFKNGEFRVTNAPFLKLDESRKGSKNENHNTYLLGPSRTELRDTSPQSLSTDMEFLSLSSMSERSDDFNMAKTSYDHDSKELHQIPKSDGPLFKPEPQIDTISTTCHCSSTQTDCRMGQIENGIQEQISNLTERLYEFRSLYHVMLGAEKGETPEFREMGEKILEMEMRSRGNCGEVEILMLEVKSTRDHNSGTEEKETGDQLEGATGNESRDSPSRAFDVELHTAAHPWSEFIREAKMTTSTALVDLRYRKLTRRIRGLLNKVTTANFQNIVDLFRRTDLSGPDWVMLAGMVFEKAILEPRYSALYAALSFQMSKMQELTQTSVSYRIPHDVTPAADDVTRAGTFQRTLLDRCQEEFEKNIEEETDYKRLKKKYEEAETQEEKAWVGHLFENALKEQRRRSKANVQFLADLFNIGLVSSDTVQACLSALLIDVTNVTDDVTDNDVTDLECFCLLLVGAGRQLDKSEDDQAKIEAYVTRLETIVNQLTSRKIKCLLLDVLEFRKNGWQKPVKRPDPIPETIDNAIQRTAMQMTTVNPQVAMTSQNTAMTSYWPGTQWIGNPVWQASGCDVIPHQRQLTGSDVLAAQNQHSITAPYGPVTPQFAQTANSLNPAANSSSLTPSMIMASQNLINQHSIGVSNQPSNPNYPSSQYVINGTGNVYNVQSFRVPQLQPTEIQAVYDSSGKPVANTVIYGLR